MAAASSDPPLKIGVEGLSAINRKLKALDAELPNEVKALNRQGAATAEAAARPLVPVDTGKLLGTLRAGATRRTGYVALGSKKVPYAAPIEWGWPARNIEAAHALTEGLGHAEPAIVAEYERGLVALLHRTGLL